MIYSCYDDFSYMDKPTEKQLKCIAIIETKLNIEFIGKTKKQATEFIKENIDKSYTIKKWQNKEFNNFANKCQNTEHDPFYDIGYDEYDSYGCRRNYNIFDDYHCR